MPTTPPKLSESGEPYRSVRFYVSKEEEKLLRKTLDDNRRERGLLDETNKKGPLVTINEASRIAGYSRQTIQKYCDKGKLGSLQVVGRTFVYEQAALALRDRRLSGKTHL